MEKSWLARIAAERAARTGAGDRPLPGALPADLPPVRDFPAALRRGRFAVIAECKAASPSRGVICPDYDPVRLARAYETGLAAAVSVLTEEKYFHGSLDHLRAVRAAVGLPILRKDFLLDPLDLHESRVAGADAVLLIVGLLGERTGEMLAVARRLGLAALVEVHDEAELAVAVAAGAALIGINNRDLITLRIDLGVSERLIPRLPAGKVVVSESGVESADGARRLIRAGARALLIGTALARSTDPAAELLRYRRGLGPAVKVCGVKLPEQAAAIAKMGVEYLGINCYPKSPRGVDRARGRDLAAAARTHGAQAVGVFVNPSRDEVEATIRDCQLDWVQLHGDETPEECDRYSVPVIKAFKVNDEFSRETVDPYRVRAWLFDSGSGGTGKTFAWEKISTVARNVPLFLAGGITPANAAAAVAAVDPDVLDLASGVESAPGLKDLKKIEQLLRALGR